MPKNLEFYELRKNAGVTQEELAKALGLKQCSISNWENGISKPDLPTAVKAADIMKVPVERLVKCFA